MLIPVPTDPSATGFLLASLSSTGGPILWVQDYTSRHQNGRLYIASLAAFGITQPILQVHVSQPRDVLWAMEEGAACTGLAAVVGEIHGAPAVLDFTATKRLAMRADTSGVPVFLLRSGDPGVLSASRERWRITSLPSQLNPYDSRSPGNPQWDVDLFRARSQTPGRWVASYDQYTRRGTDRLDLVPRTDAGAVDTDNQPIPERSKG
ncbi:MAG: hypothetical protein WBG95_12430 [Sulfitobacter sp.]